MEEICFCKFCKYVYDARHNRLPPGPESRTQPSAAPQQLPASRNTSPPSTPFRVPGTPPRVPCKRATDTAAVAPGGTRGQEQVVNGTLGACRVAIAINATSV
nr:uncharacterized protein LOC113803093 [Penaeus vannamei]